MERFGKLTETRKDSIIRAWIDGSNMPSIRNHHSAQMYKYVLDGEWYETLWRYIGGVYYTGIEKSFRDPILDSKVGDCITYDLISTTFLSPQEVVFGEEEEGNGLSTFFHPEDGVIRFSDTRGIDIREYADWFDQEEVITCGKFKVTNISMERFYFWDEDTNLLDEMLIEWNEDDNGQYFECKMFDLEYVDDESEQRDALKGLLKGKLDKNRKTSSEENGYSRSKELDDMNDNGEFMT